jgi:sigma-E factor negative regulatory protein RseB
MRTLFSRRRWLPGAALVTLVALVGALLPLGASAGPGRDEPVAVPAPQNARAWLARIHAAAVQRSYQGTMVFSAGGMLSSSRVAHFCVGDQSFERLEALDGRMQRVYRHNDTVHTLWPQSRTAVVERRNVSTPQRAPLPVAEPRAVEQYELKPEGRERMAGRDALVFLLMPRDGLRYAQRFWADEATGLMLRADVLGPARAVLESAAFSEIEIGVRPQPESVLQPMKKLDGYRVMRPLQVQTQLEAEGWAMARNVPGFLLTGCLKRPLDAAAGPAEATGVGGEQVLQAVFSDGLTHVSLFVEPYSPQRHRSDLQAQIGATSTLMLRRGEFWLTAMGDVPVATLKLFADALERRP